MKYLRSDQLRLAATYLAIIMAMSIVFSGIMYGTATQQLEHQRPGEFGRIIAPTDDIYQQLQTKVQDSEVALALQLIGINLVMLILGALISYLLAERTLEPIENNMRAQDRFISDASHELRTPITAIKTANEVALKDKKLSVNDARDVIAQNVADTTRLQALASSLLDLVKEQPLKKTPTHLAHIVNGALTAVVPQAQAKDIAIDDVTTDTVILVDEPRLVRVLVILLDNAIKYSPEHATVRIESAVRGSKQLIKVIDNGIGMSEAVQAKAFERFYRSDESRTSIHADGYGLGLAIAEQIVREHSGSIMVESTKGEGSTFTVSLPK